MGDLDADAVERFIGSAIRVQQAVESSSGGRTRRTSSTRRAAGSLDDEAGQAGVVRRRDGDLGLGRPLELLPRRRSPTEEIINRARLARAYDAGLQL